MTLQVLSHVSLCFACLGAQHAPRGRGNCKTAKGIADAAALIRDIYFATEYLCVDSENEVSAKLWSHIMYAFSLLAHLEAG